MLKTCLSSSLETMGRREMGRYLVRDGEGGEVLGIGVKGRCNFGEMN